MVGCLMRTDTSAWRPGPAARAEAGSSRRSSSGFGLKNAAESLDAARGSQLEILLRTEGVKMDAHVKHLVEVKSRFADLAPPPSTPGTGSTAKGRAARVPVVGRRRQLACARSTKGETTCALHLFAQSTLTVRLGRRTTSQPPRRASVACQRMFVASTSSAMRESQSTIRGMSTTFFT